MLDTIDVSALTTPAFPERVPSAQGALWRALWRSCRQNVGQGLFTIDRRDSILPVGSFYARAKCIPLVPSWPFL